MKLNFKSPTLRFSVSGLRGLFPEDLNPQNIPTVVSAFAKVLGEGSVAVARDNRPTGPIVEDLAVATLKAMGRNVHLLGLVPTPTLKAYVKKKKLAGGLMVSASHNPITYTAFKFVGRNGFFFNQEQNEKWKSFLEKSFSFAPITQLGKEQEISFEEIAHLHCQDIEKVLPQKLKGGFAVAIDPVNGTARKLARYFLEKHGYKVFGIHEEEKMDFSRPPEPTEKALVSLSKLCKEKKCLVGFAFDPDADRLALVREGGVILSEEYTLPLSLLSALPHRKGGVVVNLSSSFYNQMIAQNLHRQFYRTKVGEANVVNKMQQVHAAMGGEGNGGVIDPLVSSYGRDSIVAMAHVLHLIEKEEKNLGEIIKNWPTLYLEKQTLEIKEKTKIKKIFRKAEIIFKDFKKNREDGLYLYHESGLPWVHIRSSNTEPIVRIIAEAQSKEKLKWILDSLKEVDK